MLKDIEPQQTCPDCGTEIGTEHIAGCDVERCSVCHAQWISCGCENHDQSKSKWTGFWPGVLECRQLGWYTVFKPEERDQNHNNPWQPATANTPDAIEDLNRWSVFIQTGKDSYYGNQGNAPSLVRNGN